MTGLWVLSYGILWVLVISSLFAIVVLARQVGVLSRRIGTPSARMDNNGPNLGDVIPELNAISLTGESVYFGSRYNKKSLVVFITATCSVCDDLIPSLKAISKSEREDLETILISLSPEESYNREFIKKHQLQHIPYIISAGLGIEYQVKSTPYGLLIDSSRILRAKGVVNNIDHLESLLNAVEIGVPTLDSYMKKNLTSKITMTQ